jgi:branched-subunit amino acid transport protein AzlD
MKTGIGEALLLTAIMGAVIFFCRVCPFLFFRGKVSDNGIDGDKNINKDVRLKNRKAAFLDFVEKIVPPLAMTVLTFNALAGPIHENLRETIPVTAAAAFTVIVHLWRRNPLISIFGGTAVYMVLARTLL